MMLTTRQLNRATLARQMLLTREVLPIPEAIERLGGLQSQIPDPPYIGLWTRLEDFQRDDLTALITDYTIVRAAMLRSTLHLVTAADHQRFRPVLQPALDRALRAFFGKKAKSLDVPALVAIGEPFIKEQPRTTGEIRERLLADFPDEDGPAMAYAVRNNLPLVQVPPAGTWGTGTRAAYTTAESVLGPLPPAEGLRPLLERYLAAFGPASVMDFQAWTGMVRLKKALAAMDLPTYESESGEALFDLPGAPLPDADTPAPVRFIPAYDNLLVAHRDRTRVIADEDRSRVFLSAGRVLPTLLVDGFVQGVWSTERSHNQATLTVDLFRPVSDDQRTAIVQEGEHLLRFIDGEAQEFMVRLDG